MPTEANTDSSEAGYNSDDLKAQLQQSHTKTLKNLEKGRLEPDSGNARRPSLVAGSQILPPEGGMIPQDIETKGRRVPRRHSLSSLPNRDSSRRVQRRHSLEVSTPEAHCDLEGDIVPYKSQFSKEAKKNETSSRRGSNDSSKRDTGKPIDGEALNREFRRHNRSRSPERDFIGSKKMTPRNTARARNASAGKLLPPFGSSHPDRSSTEPRRACKVSLPALIIATLSFAVIALVIPSTRKVLDRTLSEMVRDTTQALSRDSQQIVHPIFHELSLLDTVPLADYDGLLSPADGPLQEIVPVLWRIPNSGSRSVNDVLSYCTKLTISDERAALIGNNMPLSIRTDSNNVAHFVDVDTTSLKGLKRAKDLELVDSNLVNVIASPFLAETANLFEHKTRTGRIFTVLRHPIDRAVADYTDLRDALPLQLQRARISISQYAHSPYVSENIMVKTLANTTTDMLTQQDVEIAMSTLEHFVVIGLWDNLEESMERFYDYFKWARPPSHQVCQESFISVQKYHHSDTAVELGRNDYDTLADRNWADMILWEKAQQLWQHQGKIRGSIV